MQFTDRRHAGQVLATMLKRYHGNPGVVVLGLPRGGVPVAYEVAKALRAPLDVFIVRKLGIPGHEEYAMGAIATGGIVVMNPDVASLRIPQADVDAVTQREQRELARREQAYRGERPPINLERQTVMIVDDGLATGSTMRAAVRAVKQQGPSSVVVAVPVGANETCAALRTEADEVICVMTPERFRAVGLWYEDFSQTSDAEVHALLDAAARGETLQA
jgi:predicted phosphoribosyltransferase